MEEYISGERISLWMCNSIILSMLHYVNGMFDVCRAFTTKNSRRSQTFQGLCFKYEYRQLFYVLKNTFLVRK